MVLQFRQATANSQGYTILDAETGQSLDHLKIVYADDEAGYIRYCKVDKKGHKTIVNGQVVTDFAMRKIRIVSRS